MQNPENSWDYIIDAKKSRGINILKEVFRFRDLLFLLVKRDLTTIYKQTILGPFWLILQPAVTALTFTIIFGRVAGLSTDGVPKFLFYYSGILLWTFFSECTLKISDTFITNADLFGKVYFPRIIMPVSVLVTALVKLFINLIIFSGVWMFYYFNGWQPELSLSHFMLLPMVILYAAAFGFSLGIIVSSLTTKYKDLRFLMQFGLQLLMYLSPIIFPLSMTSGTFEAFLKFNPLTPIVETTRNIFLGTGTVDVSNILYTGLFLVCMVTFSIFIFNRTEKTFIDSI